MADIWFVSDTHFFHDNILKFTGSDGQLIRPGFDNVEQMNECMVTKWNEVVKPQDKIWHLGDVSFKSTEKKDQVEKLYQSLRGHKRLIIGNHDNIKDPLLHRYFDKIKLWNGFSEHDFTITHIPLMLPSLRDGHFCVHGHIHQNLIEDQHYINVCVEHINYTPIHLDEVKSIIASRM